MGKVAAVIFAPHSPRVHSEEFRRKPPWSLMSDALARLGDRVRELELQAMVSVSAHWISTFPIYVKSTERHRGLLTAPECPDLIQSVPYDLPGDRALAQGIMETAVRRGLPVRQAESEDLVLDYGTLEPLRHLYPADGSSCPPLVPTSVCLKSDDAECMQWGAAIAEGAQASGGDVGLLVSGSFSHKLVRRPEQWPDPEFQQMDQELAQTLAEGDPGRAEALLKELCRNVEVEMAGRHLYTAVGAMAAAGSWAGETFGYGPSSGSGNPAVLVRNTV